MVFKPFRWRLALGLMLLGGFIAAPLRDNLPPFLVCSVVPFAVYLIYWVLQITQVSKGVSTFLTLSVGFVLLFIAATFVQTPESRWNYQNDRTVAKIKAKETVELCGGNDSCLQIKENTFGCPSKITFDRVVKFIAQGDKEAANKGVSSWCAILNEGDIAFVDDYTFGSGVARIRLKGSTQSLWVWQKLLKSYVEAAK